jgi:hypothetical protein
LHTLTQLSGIPVHEFGFKDTTGPFFMSSPVALDPSARLRTAILNEASQRWNAFIFPRFEDAEVGEMLPFNLEQHDSEMRWMKENNEEEEEEEREEEEEEREEEEVVEREEDSESEREKQKKQRERNRTLAQGKRKPKKNQKYQ